MNKLTKNDILELLENKLKVELDEEEDVLKLVDELYDINKKIIIPLNEEETFLFRKRYGVYDNGTLQSKESICKEYNIGYQKYNTVMKRVFIKLLFRIKRIDKNLKIDKINSLNTIDENILNIPISTFKIDTKIKNKLMKSFILTFQDLMENSINELKLIIGPKELEELINYVHSLNYKFLDELSSSDRKNILENSNQDIVPNSSVYWVEGINNISFDRLKKSCIYDIKSLVQNVFILPTKERLEVMKFLVETNLSYLGRKEESR